MKKIYLLTLLILVFTKTSPAQEGWFTLFTEYGTTTAYTELQFLNGDTGYMTTSWGNEHNNGGYTMKTTNGGVNWFSVEGSVARYCLFFLNEQTGWTFGGYWDDAGKRSREVFKTTNGGVNFQRIFIDSLTQSFRRMHFADVNTGWAATMSNILKTTNSGANWTIYAGLSVNSIFFNDANTGWSVTPTGIIYKTIDGGLNWSNQFYAAGNAFVYVTFINSNTGWVSGSPPNIYKTTNAGADWTAYSTSATALISNVKFADSLNGWACSQSGEIFHTSNGGISWSHQTTVDSCWLTGLSFPNQMTGYTIGIYYAAPYNHDNRLLKTTTGGITFVQNIGTEIPENFSLSQNYPNPFNPVTKIKFQIPLSRGVTEGRGVLAKLIVYDILGREITVLVNEGLSPGTYEVEWDGSNSPSGVYFYKLFTADPSTSSGQGYTETRKMVLIK